MENKYDEHIQKLLDAGAVPEQYRGGDDIKAYESLYRLLQQDIAVELPVNFSNRVEATIIAKRERPLKIGVTILICSFLLAAMVLFISVYSSRDIINVAQAMYQYRWAFIAALLITAYVIISDYIKIKHSASAFTSLN